MALGSFSVKRIATLSSRRCAFGERREKRVWGVDLVGEVDGNANRWAPAGAQDAYRVSRHEFDLGRAFVLAGRAIVLRTSAALALSKHKDPDSSRFSNIVLSTIDLDYER